MGFEYLPLKEEKIKAEEIEVTVSLTLSKTLKITVDDYTVEEDIDEEGNRYSTINASESNLKEAVESQISLPHEISRITKSIGAVKDWGFTKAFKQALDEADDWTVDDFEVIQE